MINLVKQNINIVFLIILSISAWSLNKSFETKESILNDEKGKIEKKFYLKLYLSLIYQMKIFLICHFKIQKLEISNVVL